jgi:hypothetical protein
MRRGWRVRGAMLATLVLFGCTADALDVTHGDRVADAPEVLPPSPPPALTAADSAAEEARLETAAAELRTAFERIPHLSPREVAGLRLDRNATQTASARRLGTRAVDGAGRDRLLAEGRLEALEDSTPWWILRRMENASPHLTPATRALLEELGRRFHARLDAAGLPRYRFRITSALRTDADQEALRRTNGYASRTVSAHEFGTTVDVSHERFAVPASVTAAARIAAWETGMLEEVGREHARALQAELGRAIAELRREGRLHVMMENAQPVYHMTLAATAGGGG